MADDYTPNQDYFRDFYALESTTESLDEARAEWDRMIAQVRAETLREAAEGLESGIWPEGDEAGVKGAAREIQYRADRIEKEAGL